MDALPRGAGDLSLAGFQAPRTLDALAKAYADAPDSLLLAGGTDVGLWVTKQLKDLPAIIYVGDVAELARVESRDGALEIGADVILKASHSVDGVYDRDPMKDSSATKFERLTYIEVLQRNIKVMDSTAISMCMDNRLPIIVFNLRKPGNIRRAVTGEKIGTLVESAAS